MLYAQNAKLRLVFLFRHVWLEQSLIDLLSRLPSVIMVLEVQFKLLLSRFQLSIGPKVNLHEVLIGLVFDVDFGLEGLFFEDLALLGNRVHLPLVHQNHVQLVFCIVHHHVGLTQVELQIVDTRVSQLNVGGVC